MNRAGYQLAFFVALFLIATSFSGCMSTPDDSDQPWNVPPANEGVPTFPGMNQ
jgi:hypothetical protein